MKAAFTLVALAGLALATPNVLKRKTNCDADADKAPAENDCRDRIENLKRNDQDKLPGGEWSTIDCSDTCKIEVLPEKDEAQITTKDLQGGANSIMDSCSVDGDDPIDFAGEIDGGGLTTRISKGGDC